MALKKNDKRIVVGLAAALVLGVVITSVRKFPEMMEASAKGEAKSNQMRLLSAVSIYYGDHEGVYPQDLKALVPKYIQEVPVDGVMGSSKTVKVWDGSGGWVYVSWTGEVRLNSPDSRPKE